MHRIVDPPKGQWDLLPTELTAGERKVAELFDDKLATEWEMYVQPHLNGLRPDFVLLNPWAGIAVFEIKDWSLSTLQYQVDRSTIQRTIHKIQLYKEEIFNLYCPRLNDRYGKGAITAGLIFTKIPLAEVDRILSPTLSEEMRKYPEKFPISGSEQVEKGNVDALFPEHNRWGPKKRSIVMSPDIAEDLRGWLRDPDFSQEQRKPLVLNAEQREIAETRTPSGHRRVKGPAGAGKSLALSARAATLASQGKYVLVCTFNITLMKYLRDLVVRHARTLAGQGITHSKQVRRQIDFRHFHGWCKWVCEIAGREEDYKGIWSHFSRKEVLNERMAELVRGIYIDGPMHESLPVYDAILVDEGQDFRLSWWQTLSEAVKRDGEMLLVADKTQDVYGTAAAWTERAMDGAGFSGRWYELKESYRLPREMDSILKALADSFLLPSGIEVDLPNSVQPELGLDQPPELRWIQVSPGNSLTDICFEEVRRQMRFLQKDAAYPDVIFLASDNSLGLSFVERCEQLNVKVLHTFGQDIIGRHVTDNVGVSRDSSRKKLHFYLGDARVKTTTLHSFKGWEARNLVVQVSRVDSPEQQALFYTALTRLKRHPNGSQLTVVSSCPDLAHFGERNFPDFSVSSI